MLKNYNLFLESTNNDCVPEEVSKSALIIARSMYEKVKKNSFFEEDNNCYIKFKVSDIDFKYIDPSEVLQLDLSASIMDKKEYYVELSYDDQIPSTKEVVYKIIFEKIK